MAFLTCKPYLLRRIRLFLMKMKIDNENENLDGCTPFYILIFINPFLSTGQN